MEAEKQMTEKGARALFKQKPNSANLVFITYIEHNRYCFVVYLLHRYTVSIDQAIRSVNSYIYSVASLAYAAITTTTRSWERIY